jgi:hypothetical protein
MSYQGTRDEHHIRTYPVVRMPYTEDGVRTVTALVVGVYGTVTVAGSTVQLPSEHGRGRPYLRSFY